MRVCEAPPAYHAQVSAIDEVNHARAECAWLKTYENDEGRYKARHY